MTLNLTTLSKQIHEMSDVLMQSNQQRQLRMQHILERYLGECGNEDQWRSAAILSQATATWLMASPLEPFATLRDAPPRLPDYAIVATDGSQIELDHHGIVDCYLINIGHVYVRYGRDATAKLSSHPMLYYQDNDLYLDDGTTNHIPVEGAYLSARRDVEELIAAVSQAETLLTEDIPSLVLLDGTLIRWTISGADRKIQKYFLDPYLDALDRIRARNIPVASYISRPRVKELMGTMRLTFCPDVDVDRGKGAHCKRCSDIAAGRPPSCGICHGFTDADMFALRLGEGQRGPLFLSLSPINIDRYGEHQVCYFPMRVGREIVRVEVPQWVMKSEDMLDQVHRLVYDQCVKGQGYPVALARAHEQAVVRTSDRRAFQRIIEQTIWKANIPATASRKRESKAYQKL